jgi:hypothetical protein
MCDNIDAIVKNIQLPALREGDLIIGHMMGGTPGQPPQRDSIHSAAHELLLFHRR